MIKPTPLFRLVTLVALLCFSLMAQAADTARVAQTWQLLDYLATDYAAAVADGQIINKAEYAEMREFSSSVAAQVDQLEASPAKAALAAQANSLLTLIDHKAAQAKVAQQAHRLANDLLAAYPIPTAPKHPPKVAHAAELYQQHCAACHGASGNGDGPLAAGMEPPPIAFSNAARADQRSPLSYYQTITQGVSGTAMVSFKQQLSQAERWALAYYAGTLAYRDDIQQGAELWKNNPQVRSQVSNLDELSRLRAEQLVAIIGKDKAHALVGYLRAQPAALAQSLSGLALARGRLRASVASYLTGNNEQAFQLALSAYLDGVEPVEPLIAASNAELLKQIETAMGSYRTDISQQAANDSIRQQAKHIDKLLMEAQLLINDKATSSTTTFIGALTVLLREGLEALLIVVGLIAFLTKAGRRETLPYIHAGWVLALLSGGLTWLMARYFIEISGASRELTEGLSSLFAAMVLLGVGLWMHQKSIGGRWQAYIQQKLGAALSKKSAWLLFLLAFVSVYREIFETILFYIALWQDGHGMAMLGGIVIGVLLLALIAWGMLVTSKRLPIGSFFSASSVLIAILAFVLTGKGIAGLQEAGWVGVSIAPLPHIDWLGMSPTWESSSAQLLVLLLIIGGYAYNKLRT